jgi:hypothetical protein
MQRGSPQAMMAGCSKKFRVSPERVHFEMIREIGEEIGCKSTCGSPRSINTRKADY